jgi:hypothetical protein
MRPQSLRRNTVIRLRIPLLLLAVVALVVGSSATGQAPATKAYLLSVSKGQTFTDIGSDDKTKPEFVDDKDLGKALKVAYFTGDSVGDRTAKVKNWKPFAALRFDVVNPGKNVVLLTLNVFHARTTNYNTRVVVPVKLKPGKNEVSIGIDELANVNGSAPALTDIRKWYLTDEEKRAPTLFFGDFWLEGGETPAAPAAPGGPHPLIGYRIKGKVAGMDVDLTVTPFLVPPTGTAPSPVSVHGDAARLERIRAAKMPKSDKPVLFDTPTADAICSALEVFPPDNPWNLVIEDWPLHPNSKAIVASIGPAKPFRYNPDMGFVLVPPDQPKVDVKLVGYPGESDKGPYPVPDNTPIEGWPLGYKGLNLDDVQRKQEKGDRHALVVDPVNRMLYEFYQMRKTDQGWQASQASIFDLKSNKLRPEEWTSADAAGLPIFPAVVRYDELKRGLVEHAMRVTVVRTRRAYVYPATHFASRLTDETLPRMGERLRLRRDFDVSGFSPEVQAILKGLKKYGMFVADNGLDWAISVAPDPRMTTFADELRKIKGADFEVVQAPPGYQPPGQ